MQRAHCFLLVASALAGCHTTETRRLNFSPPGEVRVAALERTWEIRSGDDVVGGLVFFESRGPAQDSVYIVRNLWNQDLGMIDAMGRAYRYLPHQRDPAWVGTGTIVQGAADILGVASPCRLMELSAESTSRSPDIEGTKVSEEVAPDREEPHAAPGASVSSPHPHPFPDVGFAQSR